jgi:hypothetical protein
LKAWITIKYTAREMLVKTLKRATTTMLHPRDVFTESSRASLSSKTVI